MLEARDGNAATTLLNSGGEIDIMLLDMTIPVCSSRDVADEAARTRPDLRIVLTSPYSEELVSASFARRQISGILRKPFRLAHLVQRLRKVLTLGEKE